MPVSPLIRKLANGLQTLALLCIVGVLGFVTVGISSLFAINTFYKTGGDVGMAREFMAFADGCGGALLSVTTCAAYLNRHILRRAEWICLLGSAPVVNFCLWYLWGTWAQAQTTVNGVLVSSFNPVTQWLAVCGVLLVWSIPLFCYGLLRLWPQKPERS